MIKLGVVDQSPVASGGDAATALRNSVDLARRCEELGYSRYWVAEHHSSEGLAGSAPEILIAKIAEATSTMRIGSGGVMLTHYSAFKVAEQFRALEAFHPGRIDLGLGRAPGSDRTTASALAKGPGALGPEHYPAQIRDLQEWLSDAPDPTGPFAHVRAMPCISTAPELWILGSSEGSAAIAAHFGLPLSFAHFITVEDGPTIAEAYRRQFKPSEAWPEPVVNVGAGVICAETDEEADDIAASIRAWRHRGLQGPIPTVEDARALEAELDSGPLAVRSFPARKPLIQGSPETCAAALHQLAADYGTDEILTITITHSHESRVRSAELLADAVGLSARAAA